jgi:hypothetical protein
MIISVSTRSRSAWIQHHEPKELARLVDQKVQAIAKDRDIISVSVAGAGTGIPLGVLVTVVWREDNPAP